MTTQITVTVDEVSLKRLVIDHLNQLFNGELTVEDLKFQVKSKNNYKPQDWEEGQFRVVANKWEKE